MLARCYVVPASRYDAAVFELAKSASSDFDWTAFWAATTAAATVATAISTTVVLWLQRRNKPWPGWILEGDLNYLTRPDPVTGKMFRHIDQPVSYRFVVTNVGDGVAYGAKAFVGSQRAELWPAVNGGPRPSNVAPGNRFLVAEDLDGNHAGDPVLRVVWLATPTRLGKWWRQDFHLKDWARGVGDDLLPLRTSRPRRWRPHGGSVGRRSHLY